MEVIGETMTKAKRGNVPCVGNGLSGSGECQFERPRPGQCRGAGGRRKAQCVGSDECVQVVIAAHPLSDGSMDGEALSGAMGSRWQAGIKMR